MGYDRILSGGEKTEFVYSRTYYRLRVCSLEIRDFTALNDLCGQITLGSYGAYSG
jgi:hypothetical protein